MNQFFSAFFKMFLAMTVFLSTAVFAQDLSQVTPVSVGLNGPTFYNPIAFANMLAHDQRNWQDSSGPLSPDASQIDELGNVKWLNSGQVLQSWTWRSSYGSTVLDPEYNEAQIGQLVLEWQGNGDVRLEGATAFISSKSSGGQTGSLNNGRRVYRMEGRGRLTVKIYEVNSTIREVKLWLPDPSDKWNKSLEGELFHPYYIDALKRKDWNHLRMMDWGHINANPQKDWSDRRKPAHNFWVGVINRRAPASGFDGDRETGMPFEVMVALANEANKDLWINVPHMATDDFIGKMARTVAYGTDGNNPYWSEQANPVWEGLKPGLKVYIEYCNEIWSSGGSFPQGNWAQAKADAAGLSREQWVARRASKVFDLFDDHFPDYRLINVFGGRSADSPWNDRALEEFFGNGSLKKPEFLAVTTYFGNGIQNYVWENLDLPKYDGLENDNYWTSSAFENDLNDMFQTWNRLILSTSSYGGDTGFDAVGEYGGISDKAIAAATEYGVPLIAYEGGPSLYTDKIDRGPGDDNAITHFIKEANRRSEFADIYYIQLNQAFERGLYSHSMFVNLSSWGKFGQWGHLEYLYQDYPDSPKWSLMETFFDEFQNINKVGDPSGAVPTFNTEADLGSHPKGQWLNMGISFGGGDGGKSFKVIGSHLPENMWWDNSAKAIKGTPNESGSFYLYARIVDNNGDAAWRNFTFQVYQRSSDSPKTVTFEGKSVTGGSDVAEPFDDSGMRFTSTKGMGVQGTGSGFNGEWESKVLKGNNWGSRLSMTRTTGSAFDLFGFDAGMFQGESLKIIGTIEGGIGTLTEVVNLPMQKDPLTWVELDWIGIEKVEFIFYELPDAQGNERNGAIDNLYINQVLDGDPSPDDGGGDDGGGDSGASGTVTFDSKSEGQSASSYSEAGVIVSALKYNGSASILDFKANSYNSTVAKPDNWNESIKIVADSGGAFDLVSFDHAGVWGNSYDATITGTKSDGSTVTSSISGSGNSLSTKTLTWTGLTEVIIDYGGGADNRFGVVDNIVVGGGGDGGTSSGGTMTLDAKNGGQTASSHTEGGLKLSALKFNGDASTLDFLANNYTSTVVRTDNWGEAFKIVADGGGNFNLESFQHAGVWGNSYDATITGTKSDGSTVTSSISGSGNSLSTKTLNWTGLTEVIIDYDGGASQRFGVIDNIVSD